MRIKNNVVPVIFLCVAFCASAKPNKNSSAGESAEKGISGGKDVLIQKTNSVSQGIVRVTVQEDLGTFGLYALAPDSAPVPVLASRPAFSSSAFFLKAGKTIYELNRSGGIRYRCIMSENGAEIIYTVNGKDIKAEVGVSLAIQSTGASSEADMVKCVIQTSNLGTERRAFAVRGILDTVLGEMAYTDFSTASRRSIDEETQFSSLFTDRWILSKNETTGMQILLSGKDITAPRLVTLANKDVVYSGSWDGNYYKAGRPFNSILSYNNSAVDLLWNDFSLDAGQRTSIVFYIVLGVQAVYPAGEHFLNAPSAAASIISAPQSENTVPVPAVPEEKISAPAAVQEKPAVKVSDVPFNVSSVKKEQLDPEYVQNLVNKIYKLESSSSSLDAEELAKLNAELDAILQVLRNQ